MDIYKHHTSTQISLGGTSAFQQLLKARNDSHAPAASSCMAVLFSNAVDDATPRKRVRGVSTKKVHMHEIMRVYLEGGATFECLKPKTPNSILSVAMTPESLTTVLEHIANNINTESDFRLIRAKKGNAVGADSQEDVIATDLSADGMVEDCECDPCGGDSADGVNDANGDDDW